MLIPRCHVFHNPMIQHFAGTSDGHTSLTTDTALAVTAETAGLTSQERLRKRLEVSHVARKELSSSSIRSRKVRPRSSSTWNDPRALAVCVSTTLVEAWGRTRLAVSHCVYFLTSLKPFNILALPTFARTKSTSLRPIPAPRQSICFVPHP